MGESLKMGDFEKLWKKTGKKKTRSARLSLRLKI